MSADAPSTLTILTVVWSLQEDCKIVLELSCLHGPLPCLLLCRLHCKGLQLGADVDLPALAASCFGYSGADLAALVREAAMHAFSTAAAQLLDTGGGEATVHFVVLVLDQAARMLAQCALVVLSSAFAGCSYTS